MSRLVRCTLRSCFAVLLLSLVAFEVAAQQSTIEEGSLRVPRIDVEGYGSLELIFSLVFNEDTQLLLEETAPVTALVGESGVFNLDDMSLELDEVWLESGDRYFVRLEQVSSSEPMLFDIVEAVHLNPPPVEHGPPARSEQVAGLYQQTCAGCHGSQGTGTAIGPTLSACANCGSPGGLADYIARTMPLGQSSLCDADCAATLAAYILDTFNSNNEDVAEATVGFIALMGDGATLRKASSELASRLPTLEEFQQVGAQGEAGLRAAIDRLMTQPEFYARLQTIWNDYLLTDKYHSSNGSEAAIRLLNQRDFPSLRWFDPGKDSRPENYNEVRLRTNDGIAREPLELITWVVRHDRPFTEILTADYMMMNAFSARSFGVNDLAFEDPDDASEFRPGRIDGMPHAGILTSPMFLNRYPTTETNRNRGRARVVFDLFLDTDILAIEGVRPGNAVDITTPIPTINNPQCAKCHTVLDPVASIFQNWDSAGRYRPARLSRDGWYTDMEPRGFNGELMPLANNIDSSVQWLARQIVADPRFPQAVTRIMVNGFTGKEPLAAPVEGVSTQAEIDAYVAERTLLNQIQARFVADNYNLKTLVREILLSPYWRADGLTGEDGVELHRLTGSSYLLSPEQLDRKIASLLGFEWRGSLDSYHRDKDRSWSSQLQNTFHQIYGGIDSDSITTRLRSPNGLMGATQLRMANELACYAVPHDFWLPQAERRLFLFVDRNDTPYNDAGVLDGAVMNRIRQQIQYLHEYLLAETLPLAHPELQFTEELFMSSLNRGRQIILNSGGDWRAIHLPGVCARTRDLEGNELSEEERLKVDQQYVIRSWMAVVAYLLADYKFVYN